MLRHQGPLLIVGLVIVFALLHLGFPPEAHGPRITGTTLLGGIAFLLMTSSIVLSTRLGVLEDLFGGLDRMYQVHRVAGTMTALFALVHFFGVPKDLPAGADPVIHALVPSAPLGMLGLILLVIGLFVALNRKIRYSRWRPTHKIMGLVYVVIIGHFMTAPAIFFDRFSASGLVLILAAIVGVVALVYSLFGMNRRTALAYVIAAVTPLERATEIVLKPVGDTLKFRPGQFAFVDIQGKGWSEPHPFTISSAPGEDQLRFAIKVLGDWTRKLREDLQPGGQVLVRGPYGRFDAMATEHRHQVWLAGGIGITPFRAKLRAMAPGDPRQIHLVYAARDRKEAIFLDELTARAAELGNVTIIPLFSEEGQFARVDRMAENLPDPLGDYAYFMCGPQPMIAGLMADLKSRGVARKNIHTEAFEFR